ncbi:MAG: hypothetical protein ACRDD1_18480 [Planctomycetia bacterium]
MARRDLGKTLLAVYLIAVGVAALANVPYLGTLAAILGIVVGVLMLLDR